ncbi:hypothetical protein MTR_1g056790 [Medicago truncatula]|uniref:Uncharacterized protein n=1 Tax=Medicago truncatula TaxID=3880 RepID=A0A072VJD6_MEDTR|nr:hypothetical protein MTR_1g056790 [Medicago truncatula]
MEENLGSFDLNLGDEDIFEIEKLEEMKIMRGEFHDSSIPNSQNPKADCLDLLE